jgi:DNA recombination protein RmuC
MPGLFDQLQKEYKITITGPTTLSALLSSLQMGFRTLAIEKRSSEVWDLLGSVKTEFRQFGDILSKTKKKLIEATNVLETSEIRTRAIEKKLRTVQELPQEQSNRLLGSDSGSEQTDVEEETA